jgi:hypothetical protein
MLKLPLVDSVGIVKSWDEVSTPIEDETSDPLVAGVGLGADP